MAERPWISVVIPTYNGESHIGEALSSIADQNVSDLEVVVVDDGSTDGTLECVEAFGKRISIKIIRRDHEGNWVANTNEGMIAASGTWISILHQDDRWRRGRLATLKQAMSDYPSARMFLHPAKFVDAGGRPVGSWHCPLPTQTLLSPAFILPRLLVQNFVPIVSPLFHRNLMEQAGPMDKALWYFADWDYWVKLCGTGPALYLPGALADFRIHPHSQTARRTHDLEDVAGQFDLVTGRVMRHAAFPAAKLKYGKRMTRFSRAVYLYMLASLHKSRRPHAELFKSAMLAGPLNWIRYLHYSRLMDRLLPRLKINRVKQAPE